MRFGRKYATKKEIATRHWKCRAQNTTNGRRTYFEEKIARTFAYLCSIFGLRLP